MDRKKNVNKRTFQNTKGDGRGNGTENEKAHVS